MKVFIFVFVLVFTVFSQETIVVISKDLSKPVLDTSDLVQHLSDNDKAKAFLVEQSSATDSDIIQAAKEILKNIDVSVDDVSSFLTEHKDLKQGLGELATRFEKISIEDLTAALEGQPEAIVHISRRRMQESAMEQKSKLFLYMTPPILSGLFVALFLIIVLLIGVSCLYDIKTNDKFARNNLWVGKES